ncbi:MAG: Chemotaxis protein CheW [Verrucomicrobiae bacterium]|nr:Chemotaxis protein CheW [Verrucomicrobiae bacterium]
MVVSAWPMGEVGSMNRSGHIVVFALDEQRVALPLSVVERVVRAVEVTPLPIAWTIVLGAINFHGQILPVFNLRRRLRLPDREMELSDHIIIAKTARRLVALVVDAAVGVLACPEKEIVPPEAIVPGIADLVSGVVKQPNGMIFIHDLDRFLSLAETQQLEAVLAV